MYMYVLNIEHQLLHTGQRFSPPPPLLRARTDTKLYRNVMLLMMPANQMNEIAAAKEFLFLTRIEIYDVLIRHYEQANPYWC